MKVGFIGFGRMGSALAEGAISAKVLRPKNVVVFSRSGESARAVKKLGARFLKDIPAVVREADLVWLCVKPQQMTEVLTVMRSVLSVDKKRKLCVVSIAAGVSLKRLEGELGLGIPIIRVMPNTPAVINGGMSGISRGSFATAAHETAVKKILKAVGEVASVPEELMDAMTAVSGSGPAYGFYLAEAMTEAAVDLGMDEALARRVVHQTIFGSGLLLKNRTETAAELRRQVTSPGGTTEAAVKYFEERGLKEILKVGVRRAAERSKELSNV